MRTRITRRASALLLASICAIGCHHSAEETYDHPIELDPRRPSLRTQATVNGVPMEFLVDTASDRTVLFERAARAALLRGAPHEPSAPRDYGQVQYRTVPVDLQLGRVYSNRLELTLVGLDLEGVDGILGWDVLHKLVMCLRWSENRLFLTNEVPAGLRDWEQYRILSEPDIPPSLVIGLYEPGGNRLIVLIDTGANDGVSLSPRLWGEWRENLGSRETIREQPVVHPFHPTRSSSLQLTALAQTVRLGPITIHRTPVTTLIPDLARFVDALLGIQAVLRNDTVIWPQGDILFMRSIES